MIPGIMAAQMQAAASAMAVYLSDSSVAPTAQNVVVTAPHIAPVGCLLIAVLRCRGDRTFAVPSGWTAVVNGAAINGATSSGTLVYVLSRANAGAADYTFVQSADAACSATVIALRGDIGSNGITTGAGARNQTMATAGAMLLAVGLASSISSSASPAWVDPLSLQMSVALVSGGTSFYGTTAAITYGASGTISASFAWGGSSEANRGVWTAEITPV